MNAAGVTPERMQALVVDTSGTRHPQLHVKLKEMGFAQVAVYDDLNDSKASSLHNPDPSLIIVFLPESSSERVNYARFYQRGATKPVEVIILAPAKTSEALRREFLNLKIAEVVCADNPLEVLSAVQQALDDPSKFAPPPDPTASAIQFRSQFEKSRSQAAVETLPLYGGSASEGSGASSAEESIQTVAELAPPDEEDERWASAGPEPTRRPAIIRFRIRPERKAQARAERARSNKLIARALIALTGVVIGGVALLVVARQNGDNNAANNDSKPTPEPTPAAIATPTPAPAPTTPAPTPAIPLLPELTPAPTPTPPASLWTPAISDPGGGGGGSETPDFGPTPAPFGGATPRPFSWDDEE